VAAAPPATALVVGRYALYGKIAAGGMATVYFGRMLGAAGFTRTVAIKRLHPHLAEEPDFVSMMIDEARLVARVQHPNVAQTLDVVAEGGELLIVMEYVAGESLARLLRAESQRQRLVPAPLASAVISGMLHGLHAAHMAKSDRGVPLGIVHRDISPHNVIVGVDGLARVIDFGVAKAAGRIQTTRAGVVKGKLPYMAPEQLAGQDTSRLADIYAAGVVLWEMLTGRRMFKADDDATLLSQVLAGPQDRPRRWVPGLPAALDAVVMRALARDPAARFATAREMADALVRAVPPALATDVGAWVEDAARQVLDERSARLSDIESQSSQPVQPVAASLPPALPPPLPYSRPVPAPPLASGVSQPSSIAIETQQGGAAPAQRGKRTLVWLVAGGVAVAAGGIALGFALRTGAPSQHGAAPPAAVSNVPAARPPPPASVAAVPASASASSSTIAPIVEAPSSVPAPSAAPIAVPVPASPAPVVTAARPTVAPARPSKPGTPNPAGSVIFATPD
jgi:serine/threonine-protein kinase